MTPPKTHQQFVAALRDLADPSAVADVSRFFRADPEARSGDNKILGVSIGSIFPVAKQFADMPLADIEQLLDDAQLAADVATLDRLIAEDLLFTGPDGRLGTKAEDLAAHRSGVVRFHEHVPEELLVRRVGTDVAVASLRARLAVEVAGVLRRGTYRYTRVWAREGGGSWMMVGGHVSEIPPGAAGGSPPA